MKTIFIQCDEKHLYLKMKDDLIKKGYTLVKDEQFDRTDRPIFVQIDDGLALFSVVSQACVKGNYIINYNDLIF